MKQILLIGGGRMGTLLKNKIDDSSEFALMDCITDQNSDMLKTLPRADAVIDFSSPAAFEALSGYISRTGAPLVCGTTGLSKEQNAQLEALSETVPVLYAANFSLGVTIMNRILRQTAEVMKANFEIEISETHHRHKVDAPSGTAKMLLHSIDPEGKYEVVTERKGHIGARAQKEIGMHVIRGGTVSGIHTVSFFGEDEVLEITHTAYSREIFANGALSAAKILADSPAGYYSLEDVIFGKT